jgi:cytochrome P450
VTKRPEVLSKLRAEHSEVLGSDPSDAIKVIEQHPQKLNELRYTVAVIKETLRHHNVGLTFRQGSPNFNFVLDGVHYQTYDSMIQTSPTLMNVRSDLWPRETEFLPERYLVPEDHPLHPPKNAWRSFELGNTRCIGEELAMIELRLGLVLTMRELEFDFKSPEWDKLQLGGTTEPSPTVAGECVYRCGEGIGFVKDNMPTRIRRRRVDVA